MEIFLDNVNLDSLTSLTKEKRAEGLSNMSLTAFDRLCQEADNKPFNERTDAIQEVIGEINARQIELINEKIANLQSLPKEDLLVLQGWIADNTQISGVNADLSRIRGDIDDLIQNMDNVTPNDFQFDFEIPSETNTPVTLESLASMPVEDRLTALQEISLTDTYNLHKEVLQKDGEAVEKITQKIQNNEELTEEESAIRDIEIALADKAFMKMEGDKEKTTAEDLQTLVAYYSEKGHFDFAEKANARLAELQNTGNNDSEPTDTPSEENSEDKKPSFNVEGYMDEHFLKHNLKKQLADIKLIKYHATNISEEDKPKVLEAIEKAVAQKAAEVNSGKALMLDYDEKYIWRDILREFSSSENKEPDKEIMKALEDVNSDITSFEEEYGIDDAHMQSEEQIAQNIDAIKNLDKIDFFVSIEEPKEKPWTAEQLKNWKENEYDISLDFHKYAGALRTKNLSEEDKAKILEKAKGETLYNFKLQENPEIYGDCKFVLEELAKVYPDDELVKANKEKLNAFLEVRGTTLLYPEMAETAKYLDKINIKSDIQMFGRSDIKQNTPDSEIAKLKELARIETETYLANITPAGQTIDDKAFAKEYSERLNKYILGVVVADRAAKGAPKEDINLQKFFEGNGKIDINQSSCIGYFAAQSNRNTAAVNQTEGRRPGLKEKLADIKDKIEKFDKECTQRYGTKYTVIKNIGKSVAMGTAYSIAAMYGSPAVAALATVSSAKHIYSFVKNYKHEKEALKAQTGKDLSFGAYAWNNKLSVLSIIGSASTVGFSAVQALGVNPDKLTKFAKAAYGFGLAFAGACKQGYDAYKQVKEQNQNLPKDQQKNAVAAGFKAAGVSIVSFTFGIVGGNVVAGAAAPYFANTEINNSVPLQVNDSVPLQGNASVPLQGNDSVPLQASDSVPLQASDSVPLQASDSVPLQASDSVPLQASDSVPLQASDSVPLQASDSVPLQASDSVPLQASDSVPLQGNDSVPLQGNDSIITQILNDIERQEAQEQGSATVEVSAKDTQFWDNRANQFLGKENVDSLYSRIDSGEIKLPEGIESKEEFAYKLAMAMEQSPKYVSEALGIDFQNTRMHEAQIPNMTNEQFAKLGNLMNDYSDRGNYEGDRPFETTKTSTQTNTENNTQNNGSSGLESNQDGSSVNYEIQGYQVSNDRVFVPEGMTAETFENTAKQLVGDNNPQAVEEVSFLLYQNAILQNVDQQLANGLELNDEQAAALLQIKESYNNSYNTFSEKYNLPSQQDLTAHASLPLFDIQHENQSQGYNISNDTVFIPEGMDIDLFVGPASQMVGTENQEALADVSSLLLQNAEIRNVEQQIANGVELSDMQEARLAQLKTSYDTYYQELSAKYNLPPQETLDNYTDQMLDYIHGRDSSPAETLTNNNIVSFNENNNMHIEGISLQTFEDVAKQTVGNDPQAVKDLSLLMYYDAVLQDVTQQAANGVVFNEEQAPQIANLQALHDKLYTDLDAKYDLPAKEELSNLTSQTVSSLQQPVQEQPVPAHVDNQSPNENIDLSSYKASNTFQINENGDGRSLYSIKDANGNVVFEQQFTLDADMKAQAQSLLPEREPVTRENYQNQMFSATREANTVAELQTLIARDELYQNLTNKEDLSAGEQAFMQQHEKDLARHGITHDSENNLTRVCATTKTMNCDHGVSYSFDSKGQFHMNCENGRLSTIEAQDIVYKDLLSREQENKPLGLAEKQFMQQHRENLQEQHMTYNHKGDLVKLGDDVRVTGDGAAYSIKVNVSAENTTYGFNQQNYLNDAKALLGDNTSAKGVMEVKSLLMNDDIYSDLKARVDSGETFSESEQKAITKFMANHEERSATIMEKYGLIRDKDGEVHRAQNSQTAQNQMVINRGANPIQTTR